MDDREDGELSGSEESIPEVKTTAVPEPALYSYRSSHSRPIKTCGSSDEQSSDADSDDENCHLKITKKRKTESPNLNQLAFNTDQHKLLEEMNRQRKKNEEAMHLDEPKPVVSKKKNNIWANVINEQSLEQCIGGVGLKKLDGDRSVENYDYRAAQELAQKAAEEADGELEDGEMIEEDEEEVKREQQEIAKRLSRKRPMAHRTYKPPPPPQPNGLPGEPLVLQDLNITPATTDEQVAHLIASALSEQKPQIICGIVEVMGRDVAIELYNETKILEKEGGEMTLNGSRRRTSGGLYLQLLKRKRQLTKEEQAIIFPPDEAQQLWRRRRRAVHKRRNNRDRHDSGGVSSKTSAADSSSNGLSGRVLTKDGEIVTTKPKCNGISDDTAGSLCPLTSPVPSPGPTPNPTPVVTPHCSDAEDDLPNRNKTNSTDMVDAKAGATSLVSYDNDFLAMDEPAADEMDVF